MSAFLVKHETIGLIAKYAFDADILQYGQCYDIQHEFNTLDKVATILAQENLDSVSYRYNSEPEVPEDQFYIAACKLAAKEANPRHDPTNSVDMAKTLNCLEYQSCERPDWYQSLAFKILTACREQLLRNMPGYESAEGWS